MPADPASRIGRRPILSTSAIATNVTSTFVTEVIRRDDERVALVEADRLPQRRRVVEDHVDPDELLEHRQQDADPHDRQQPEPWPAQRGVLDDLRRPWRSSRSICVTGSARSSCGPSTARSTATASSCAPGRPGSGATPGSAARAPRRRRPGPPRPGTSSATPRARATAPRTRRRRSSASSCVGQQRREDAERDRELLQRAEPAADRGRGDLGDVRRGDHRRDADADAADRRARSPGPRRANAQRRADRGHEEQHRAEQHDLRAAPPVGEPPAEPGADRAAEQRDRDREAGHRRVEVELAPRSRRRPR